MPVDDKATQDAMDALIARMGAAALRTLPLAAAAVLSKTMPRTPVKQGTLRRSEHMEGPSTLGEGIYGIKVGPATVYGRRIELGFDNMRDSLGRLYHQKPKPYFRPGVLEAVPAITEMFKLAYTQAIKGG